MKQRDADLDKLQGLEYDVIFLDEATQLSEYQMRTITATLRGVNDFPSGIVRLYCGKNSSTLTVVIGGQAVTGSNLAVDITKQ